MNDISKFKLSAPANSRLFRELGGVWLEISAVMAQQLFNDTNIELCIFYGENESVLTSVEQLEEAIANNEILAIYIGDTKPSPDQINWQEAEEEILSTGVIILQKPDGKYHLCRKLDEYSFYSNDTKEGLIADYFEGDLEAYTYND